MDGCNGGEGWGDGAKEADADGGGVVEGVVLWLLDRGEGWLEVVGVEGDVIDC